jgi:hypothetical protein
MQTTQQLNNARFRAALGWGMPPTIRIVEGIAASAQLGGTLNAGRIIVLR